MVGAARTVAIPWPVERIVGVNSRFVPCNDPVLTKYSTHWELEAAHQLDEADEVASPYR